MRAARAAPELELLPHETADLALRGLSDGVEEERNPKLPAREGFRDLDEGVGEEVEMENEVAAAAAAAAMV